MLSMFLRGLILGLSIAAPVGPIGVLCINRTLLRGWLVGLVSGLGAACADAIYGCISISGITIISSHTIAAISWLKLVGGLYLLYLGYRTLSTAPTKSTSEKSELATSGLAGAFISTFGLTLTNPMTIISFAAMFAAIGTSTAGSSVTTGAILVFGVFLGSALWWLMLSGGVGILSRRLADTTIGWINRLSGIVIIGFGLWSVLC